MDLARVRRRVVVLFTATDQLSGEYVGTGWGRLLSSAEQVYRCEAAGGCTGCAGCTLTLAAQVFMLHTLLAG